MRILQRFDEIMHRRIGMFIANKLSYCQVKFTPIVIALLFSISWAFAQNSISDSVAVSTPLHLIYANHFQEFEKNIVTYKMKDENAKVLLNIFALRWKEIPVAYSKASERYHQLLLAAIKGFEAQKQKTPLITYYKVCANMLLAEYHFLLDENWSALRYSQKAYPLISEIFTKNYTQPEFLFVKGLYLYYVEHFRQKNIFYRTALAPLRSGNKKKGIEFLQSCAKQESMAQVEAEIYLAHILLHFEGEPNNALINSRKLVARFPDNLKFSELLTDNLIRCGLYREAMPLVEKLKNQKAIYFSIPAHYFNGIIEEEFHKNLKKAQQEYELCLKPEYKPIDHYKKLASLRLKKL